MSNYTRRDFLKFAGAAGATTLGAFGLTPYARAGHGAGHRVVVIGAGFGGATFAKYLRMQAPAAAVTVVESSTNIITCPFSNLVLGGLRSMESITHSYDALKTRHGVDLVLDTVTEVDPVGKNVTLQSGRMLAYDRLVMSPGIGFKWGAIQGYDEAATEVMPHAWKAGSQTTLLRKQLESMKDGGTVIIVAPPNPFRCPPGPYERASMIAHYLKAHKPKSKILILDAKDDFSKKGLFLDAWSKLYPGMIEWVPGSKGGTVVEVNVKTRTLDAQLDKHKAAVANVIPPQTAGEIALKTGLANETGFCPVDPKTFESKRHPGIHVIGDASIAGALPKSGFAANSAAKMCASAIAWALKGKTVGDASFVNTCYSLIAPKYAISVAGVYRVSDQGIVSVEGSGGVSPKDASDTFREDEARYTFGWYDSITADTWG